MRGDFGIREFLGDVVVRPLMLVAWLLVFWGTLLFGGWLWSLATLGLQETWSRIRPHEGDAWAMTNFVLPLVAVAVWAVIGFLRWRVLATKRQIGADADDAPPGSAVAD
jgi:hypothetical protein